VAGFGGGDIRTLSAKELPRDVQRFTADNDDLLAIEELLRNDAGEAAQQVTLAVDNNLTGEQRSAARLPVFATSWQVPDSWLEINRQGGPRRA